MDYPIGIIVQSTIILLMFLIVALEVNHLYRVSKRQRKALEEFSNQNGFTPRTPLETGSYKDRLGLLFQLGRKRQITNSISGPIDGFRAFFYKYSFTVGHGRHQVKHNSLVCEVKIGNRLPHIFFDAKSTGHGVDKSVREIIQKANQIATPVELGDDFTMYDQTRLEQEAYELFTPEILKGIRDYASKYDIEIVGDTLFLYCSEIPQKSADYQYLFNTVGFFTAILKDNLKGFKMPPLPTKPGANLHDPRQLTLLTGRQKLLLGLPAIFTIGFFLLIFIFSLLSD